MLKKTTDLGILRESLDLIKKEFYKNINFFNSILANIVINEKYYCDQHPILLIKQTGHIYKTFQPQSIDISQVYIIVKLNT